MKKVLGFSGVMGMLMVLASCGADGQPVPPAAPSTNVSAGVTVGSGGVQPRASVVTTTGNVSIGVGVRR